MTEILKTYLGELLILVNEMSPYLLLGFFFAGLLRVLFPRRYITRYMGQRNFRSVLNASPVSYTHLTLPTKRIV